MKIVIIGAGFGGIGAAIKLRQAGFHDVVILERADDVGGVWRDNTYPGCACDVESHLYSFSFAPNPAWSQSYSGQREILAYLRKVADEYGIRPLVRFGATVNDAAWVDGRWRIDTSRGVVHGDVLIAAQGALSDPVIPKLDGLDAFRGKAMHSARWDTSYDLRGKRVAVIGTGASSIQIVPAIQPVVDKLTIFQRTPPWILPRRGGDIPASLRTLYAALPVTQRAARGAIALYRELFLALFLNKVGAARYAHRQALRYLRRMVPDDALRAKLTPDYAVGCKRILLSNDYLPALTKPNVDVVTERIARVTESGVVDETGRGHDVDAIIFGTGFHTTELPLAKHVRGRFGRTLAETWNGSMKAHLGTTLHGFPSFFFILGPNTGLGHSSVVAMMEPQFDHIVGALQHMQRNGIAAIEPTQEAQDEYVAWIDEQLRGTVWLSGGCKSWYLDDTGRSPVLWPGSTIAYARRVSKFRADEYRAVDHAEHVARASAPAMREVSP